MSGDDRKRFCDTCQRFVFNVSAMDRDEREAFADPANRRECVYYARRSDGGVADLSFFARLRRRFPSLGKLGWTAMIAMLPLSLTGCMGVRCEEPRNDRPASRDDSLPSGLENTQPQSGAGLERLTPPEKGASGENVISNQ